MKSVQAALESPDSAAVSADNGTKEHSNTRQKMVQRESRVMLPSQESIFGSAASSPVNICDVVFQAEASSFRKQRN